MPDDDDTQPSETYAKLAQAIDRRIERHLKSRDAEIRALAERLDSLEREIRRHWPQPPESSR